MRWVVTGGCGFIGTSLIRRLVDQGDHEILIIDNLSVGQREDLKDISKLVDCVPGSKLWCGDTVSLCVANILDADVALWACGGAHVVIHLAANTGVPGSLDDPRGDCMNNIIGTLNYLEAARVNDTPRFVLSSSSAPLGECQPPIHEQLAPRPMSPYGASKLAGEGYCSAYFHSFGIDAVALRFGNVYGPGSVKKNSVVAAFIKQALDGEPLIIYGDGRQTRDFIFVQDLIDAIYLAATTPGIGGEVFQIATSAETSVHELAELVTSILKQRGINIAAIEYDSARHGDIEKSFADTAKARDYLGWRASTSLKSGLAATADWFLATTDSAPTCRKEP